MSAPTTNVPAPAPRVSTQAAMQAITEEINNTVSAMGANATQLQAQISQFVTQITPIIENALIAGDLTTLKYTRDAITAHLARASLQFLHQQQQAIAATVSTTLSMLIKVGAGAIVAAA